MVEILYKSGAIEPYTHYNNEKLLEGLTVLNVMRGRPFLLTLWVPSTPNIPPWMRSVPFFA
jgi:hypothetical protein